MNTPKFQMRKMQRQMIKERDYRDGLERELAAKLALIAQRGTTLNCLCMTNRVSFGIGQTFCVLIAFDSFIPYV